MDVALVSLLLAPKTVFVIPNSIKIKFSRPLLLSFRMFNPFVPSAPFLNPQRTSENRKDFLCFQGAEKGCIGNESVNFIFRNLLFVFQITTSKVNLEHIQFGKFLE